MKGSVRWGWLKRAKGSSRDIGVHRGGRAKRIDRKWDSSDGGVESDLAIWPTIDSMRAFANSVEGRLEKLFDQLEPPGPSADGAASAGRGYMKGSSTRKRLKLADGRVVDIRVRYSGRTKSPALSYLGGQTIELVLPAGGEVDEGLAFAKSKEVWIAKQLGRVESPGSSTDVAASSRSGKNRQGTVPRERLELADGRTVDIHVRRSSRAKRINLNVDGRDGTVELVLPTWGDLEEGLAFAKSEEGWIAKQLDRAGATGPFADGVPSGGSGNVRGSVPRERLELADGRTVDIHVRRSSRAKRINLNVDRRDGTVELVLPKWAEIEEGLAFAKSEEGWIAKQLDRREATGPFTDGAASGGSGNVQDSPPRERLELADGRTVDIHVRRSSRAKRINLNVNRRDGTVELVLPTWGDLEEGLAFAKSKAGWIALKLGRVEPPEPFADGVASSGSGNMKGAGDRERLILADGRTADIRVRHSDRAKRMSLKVDRSDGAIELVLPAWGKIDEGLAFAKTKGEWIAQMLDRVEPPEPFADGATIPVMGNRITIRHVDGLGGKPSIVGNDLVVNGPVDLLAAFVEHWLKNRASEEIGERVETFSRIVGREPAGIRLGDTVSKWGSCSHKGRLSFSWRLVMAPPRVLEYVVAHEMAHLLEFNHSPRFWELVEGMCPDFESSRRWLKQHGAELHKYGREAKVPH